MKKDNFYKAVLSIFQEQGWLEAEQFLMRRGMNRGDAITYLASLCKEEGFGITGVDNGDTEGDRIRAEILENGFEVNYTKDDIAKAGVHIPSLQSESDEPPNKSSGFFSRLFNIK